MLVSFSWQPWIPPARLLFEYWPAEEPLPKLIYTCSCVCLQRGHTVAKIRSSGFSGSDFDVKRLDFASEVCIIQKAFHARRCFFRVITLIKSPVVPCSISAAQLCWPVLLTRLHRLSDNGLYKYLCCTEPSVPDLGQFEKPRLSGAPEPC